MITAFRDSFILLHLRWLLIRSGASRMLLGVGLLALIFGLVAISSTGSLIKTVATMDNPEAEAAKIFAQSYLRSFQSGELSGLVSSTLAFAIASVILAPFTGTSMTSLMPHHQLVSITRSSRHRFSDSIIAQFFSSISLLQLLMLTFIASLLTIDEGRIQGVIFAWATWPCLVLLSCFSVWLSEFMARRYAFKKQMGFFLIVILVGLLAVALDPNHGTTLFGVGQFYSDLAMSSHTLSFAGWILAFIMIATVDVALMFASYRMCLHALAEPEREKTEKKQKRFTNWRPSESRYIEIAHAVFSQVWRNAEIRKPLIMMSLFSATSLFFLADRYSLLTGLVLIVPLISALSWGSNMFGMLGSGWVWLSTNPFIRSRILYVGFALQVGISFLIFGIISLPSLVAGKVDTAEFSGALCALLVTAFIMSRSALSKSVHKPYPYRAGQRGESALSPATILIYTVAFTGWAGLAGLLTTAIADPLIQVLVVLLVGAWTALRLLRLQHKLMSKPELQAAIIRAVGSDNN